MALRFASFLAVLLLLTLPASAQSPTQGGNAALAPMLEWPAFPDALESAKESNRIVLVDVWSRNCGWCRKQQTEVYTQPYLQAYLLDTFELGRLDIDLDSDTLSYRGYTLSSQMLSAGFGATATPTTIFLEPDGSYITRLAGFHAYEDFFGVIRYIGSHAFREMSFEDFLQKEGE
ncbi:MAG: thioredoxin family protein [Bacteroidetes bacterium]|nr:thioredoxin family protein [Bacteroidota bacterium]